MGKTKYPYLNILGNKWTQEYIVYGTKDKKTGKIPQYAVIRNQDNKFRCNCLAYMCGRSRPCKHIIHIKSYLHINKK